MLPGSGMKSHEVSFKGRPAALRGGGGGQVFRGHFRHTIDPKGRLSIPSKFREVLREAGSDRLVMAPNSTALDVYPEDKWRDLEERVAELPKMDPESPPLQPLARTASAATPRAARRSSRRGLPTPAASSTCTSRRDSTWCSIRTGASRCCRT